MAKKYAGSANHVTESTTKTIHTGIGKLRSILASVKLAGSGTITFYDNTAGSGAVLLVLGLSIYIAPQLYNFPTNTPLVFTTGLTIVTTAGAYCTVITEA